MFVKYGKEYAALASFLNDKNEEKRVLKAVDEMVKSIEKSGWDGEWFVRAYDAQSNGGNKRTGIVKRSGS